MSGFRLAWVAVSGAVLSAALVVLVSRPWRLLRCATPTAGTDIACEERRAWDWPDAPELAGALLLGPLVATLLATPFLRRR